MHLYFVIFITSFLHGVNQVASWNLTANHRGTYANLTFICTADTSLSNCLMRFVDHSGNAAEVLDLSQGHGSVVTNFTGDGGVPRYFAGYEGAGLRSGECGIQFSNLRISHIYVSCHVKAEQGGWQTRAVAYDDAWQQVSARVPDQTAVSPGGNFSIQCSIDGLRRCYLNLPITSRRNESLIQTPYELKHIVYTVYTYDQPSGDNECHFTLTNIAADDAGLYYCYAEASWNNVHGTPSILIVPKLLTNDPKLVLTSAASYKAGDIMTATCEVSNTLPVASIVWLIASETIREDQIDDIDRNVLSWLWEDQVITQNISHQLRATDHDKELVCRATVLSTTRSSKIRINLAG